MILEASSNQTILWFRDNYCGSTQQQCHALRSQVVITPTQNPQVPTRFTLYLYLQCYWSTCCMRLKSFAVPASTAGRHIYVLFSWIFFCPSNSPLPSLFLLWLQCCLLENNSLTFECNCQVCSMDSSSHIGNNFHTCASDGCSLWLKREFLTDHTFTVSHFISWKATFHRYCTTHMLRLKNKSKRCLSWKL